MTFEEIRKNPEVIALLQKGNSNLGVLGFTDHSMAHCAVVADRAAYLLRSLGFSEHEQELARIAGILHDIGNAINRVHHAEIGALLASQILRETDLPLEDRITVLSAIGNHDESTGGAKDHVSAAVVIADKTDVRRSRVRQKESFDIHGTVNYAVTGSTVKVAPEERKVSLNLQVDTQICTMYEYFDIFLGRMMMCRKACSLLDAQFRLTVNGGKIL